MNIGAAAERSGCPVPTIRYYEEIGLIPIAARKAGRRLYAMRDVELLRLIRRLRSMEFGIEDVRTFLGAMTGPASACLDVRDLALRHLAVVRERRREIEALERTLAGIAGACSDACTDGDCTIIADMAGA